MSVERGTFTAENKAEHVLEGKHVAVIGGGPAGALTACLLAREEVEVDIFEPKPITRPDVVSGKKIQICTGCAGWLQESAIEVLDSVGLEIPESVIQRRIEESVVHFPNENEAVTLKTNSTLVYRGFAPVNQPTDSEVESFDAWLLRKAEEAGATLYNDRVKGVDLAKGEGEERGKSVVTVDSGEAYHADMVIGAYGHNPKLAGNILYDGKETSLELPKTNKAVVREYHLGREKVDELGNRIHVFGNPTKNIWFGAIFPKLDFVTVVLMGRDEITPTAYHEFLQNPAVDNLVGNLSNRKGPSCGCISHITVESPKNTIVMGEDEGLLMINIGDAGATRLRKNGVGAALNSARMLTSILLEYGDTAKAAKMLERYFRREYLIDNHAAKITLAGVNLTLDNQVLRRTAIAMANGNVPMATTLTKYAMDYVLSGEYPYWQLFPSILAGRPWRK